MCVAASEVYDKTEGRNIERQNTSLYAYYSNVSAMVHFTFKLQLQFRKKKEILVFNCKFQIQASR
jgi:hypothetical protein